MHIDQSDLYHQNSAVFKNFVLHSPDPPSVCTEGLGTRLDLANGGGHLANRSILMSNNGLQLPSLRDTH